MEVSLIMKPWLLHYDEHVPETLTYPEMPIYEMLDRSAKAFPGKTATVFYGKTTSYLTIKNASDGFAKNLSPLIEPGERIGVMLPNYPGFLIAYYGILKAGGKVLLLNPLYTESELQTQIGDANAVGLITIPMFAAKAASLARRLKLRFVILSRLSSYLPLPMKLIAAVKEQLQPKGPIETINKFTLEEMSKKTNNFKPAEVDIDSEAVMIYSGGTTGVAKGIMLSHRAIVTNAHQIATWGKLNPGERILAVLPLFHGYGMNVCMNSSILSGMSLILLPRFKASEMAKTIHRYKPTLTAAVPTILTALSNLPDIDSYDFTSLKAVWVGAAPLTKATKEEFERKAGCRVIEGYGLTESVTAIMANPYLGKHKVGSIGLPFPDVDAKIVSLEDESELPPHKQGEIVIKTPTVMLGYHNRTKETNETIKNGWLYTGDIGYMDDEGYFYITDRKKDLIIVGGFNVFPREIDEVLAKHPAVKEAIAVGVPDGYKGEKIKAYVVKKESATLDEDELKRYLKEHLAPYKVPSEIEFRSSLPKNAIGKILRRQLRQEEIQKLEKENESTEQERDNSQGKV